MYVTTGALSVTDPNYVTRGYTAGTQPFRFQWWHGALAGGALLLLVARMRRRR